MPFAHALLQVLVRLDARALDMTEAAVPFVVDVTGRTRKVGSRTLPRPIVERALAELLPPEIRDALDDIGAVRFVLEGVPGMQHELFTVVAMTGSRLRVRVQRWVSDDETLKMPAEQSLWPAA